MLAISYVFPISFLSVTFFIIISAILSCVGFIEFAAIKALRFPFAPACAKPLKFPSTIMFPSAINSAPLFTSPKIIKLPSKSILFPERIVPLNDFSLCYRCIFSKNIINCCKSHLLWSFNFNLLWRFFL